MGRKRGKVHLVPLHILNPHLLKQPKVCAKDKIPKYMYLHGCCFTYGLGHSTAHGGLTENAHFEVTAL